VETLQGQFLLVKNETNTSHVMEFGDRRLRTLPVGKFLGENETRERIPLPKVPVIITNNWILNILMEQLITVNYLQTQLNAVDSREVVKTLMERKILLSQTKEESKSWSWKLKRLNKANFLYFEI
jgi:hypothetical protein